MTYEERIEIRGKLEWKIHDLFERLERFCAETSGLTLAQIGVVSDVIKDMTEAEKNLAKVHHLESDHPVHDEKKY